MTMIFGIVILCSLVSQIILQTELSRGLNSCQNDAFANCKNNLNLQLGEQMPGGLKQKH